MAAHGRCDMSHLAGYSHLSVRELRRTWHDDARFRSRCDGKFSVLMPHVSHFPRPFSKATKPCFLPPDPRRITAIVLSHPAVDTPTVSYSSPLQLLFILFLSQLIYHAALSFVGCQVLPGDQRECRASRPSAEMAEGQPRRRGSRADSAGSTLSKIHELADHLQKHVRKAHNFPSY